MKLPFFNFLAFLPKQASQAGYTLIELLVVVGIIGLLLGGGMVSYQGFNSRQIAAQESKEVRAFLSRVRTAANTGDIPSGCNGKLQYVQVSAIDTTTLQSRFQCAETGSEIPSISYSLKKADAVAISNSLGIFFLPLSRGVATDASGTRPNQTISVTITVNGLYPNVFYIDSGGNFTDENPSK